MEVLGMSETAAHNWFDGTETTEMSIAQLVSEIKDYVNTKPANFRMLFMVDDWTVCWRRYRPAFEPAVPD